ncbi:MAG: hypothetical protein A2921_02470 [Candidatus Magasanikbacteria bacterium RIFCSPLOWO2_01_FULL_43_20b]|uniref:Uncharacterized protein n=1 Tax=Candidatus Magasanikbacteria bacterium RIFCSPLOWO2_12_FULL_43_12 TaxID=1798692 RepID=A0A1F6MVS8_9BACT|nr:MAG: hypothetical protein A3C74_02515 [Candidatus Magasanikbacteria bacterium RIFCSPHIGHO2_02_FULL_44_13]OGH71536.1 MAG: hypothetical protein A3I93_00690 [Candidatus Magasanikbacteria bacterium RIFCSPLOWO2_02_FULL_43_22]OGH73644.1 MAG: hypothetical protein A2921_02470 [Candidatus Magasanikbacteria bacterium RIFCSPLOWO2_01_FULL_43_20b]OGH75769.1 MAG: hypothetical protein A3G00_04545 [Candidatus Magasanikbacteria bacterium RIFCSPLOWO2_12_FULL_43_12]
MFAKANGKKLAAHIRAPPAVAGADFRLFGRKVLWLWENPWAIVAENPPFTVMSRTYEKVRTFFKGG